MCYFSSLKRISESVPVLFNDLEAVMVLTLIFLKLEWRGLVLQGWLERHAASCELGGDPGKQAGWLVGKYGWFLLPKQEVGYKCANATLRRILA